MRILGIDPGTRITGYGIMEQHGNRLLHIDNGTIQTRSSQTLAERLQIIHRELGRVISCFGPQEVAVEEIFLAKNALSALKLGHARGAALLAGTVAGLPVYEYSALQVKSAVVGYGKADKVQVQHMVRILMALPEIAQEDASDALAVAICHAHSRHLGGRLQRCGQ
jgi:crossover junction endodeoxyribonuclease RuvC